MYARIQDGYAVDVRAENPKGFYTDNIVAEFVTVPNDVRNGWMHSNGLFTAPPEPVLPTLAELAAIAAQEAARVLAAERKALLLKIDNDTDAIYRAVLGDRATEYMEADVDAKAYKKDGYTGTVPDSVASWAAATGKSATWATDDILDTARGWRQAKSSIRATRLTCKERAKVEADLKPIDAQWAGFVVAIKTALGVE
jgi:uncharacterized protein YkwD